MKTYVLISMLILAILCPTVSIFAEPTFEECCEDPNPKTVEPMWVENQRKWECHLARRMKQARMGENIPHLEPYKNPISATTLQIMAVSGPLMTYAGVSLSKLATAPATMVAMRMGGTILVASGISIGVIGAGYLLLYAFNPGYLLEPEYIPTFDEIINDKVSSEFSEKENKVFALEGVTKAQFIYKQAPENLLVQRQELQAQVDFQTYKMEKIEQVLRGNTYYKIEYRQALSDGWLLDPIKTYIAQLNEDIEVLDKKIKTINKDFHNGKDRSIGEKMYAKAQAARDKVNSSEKLWSSIDATVQHRLKEGELHWSAIIQRLYEKNLPDWMILMNAIHKSPSIENIN